MIGCGVPTPGVDVVVVDVETKRRCAPDVVGEIWVRSASVALGYWGKPELSREVFQAVLGEGGGEEDEKDGAGGEGGNEDEGGSSSKEHKGKKIMQTKQTKAQRNSSAGGAAAAATAARAVAAIASETGVHLTRIKELGEEEGGERGRAGSTGSTGSTGYLRTGDLGFLSSERGELVFVGRIKDVLIVRGRNYAPQDVEQAVERASIKEANRTDSSTPPLRRGGTAAFATRALGRDRQQVVVAAEIDTRDSRGVPR